MARRWRLTDRKFAIQTPSKMPCRVERDSSSGPGARSWSWVRRPSLALAAAASSRGVRSLEVITYRKVVLRRDHTRGLCICQERPAKELSIFTPRP